MLTIVYIDTANNIRESFTGSIQLSVSYTYIYMCVCTIIHIIYGIAIYCNVTPAAPAQNQMLACFGTKAISFPKFYCQIPIE